MGSDWIGYYLTGKNWIEKDLFKKDWFWKDWMGKDLKSWDWKALYWQGEDWEDSIGKKWTGKIAPPFRATIYKWTSNKWWKQISYFNYETA